jgi:hypothetical protein
MEGTELKERFIILRAKGYSFDRISKELNKAKQTLVNWSRELEEEIANARALELESLYEQFFLTKQKKIEVLGEVTTAIRGELERRDFSDVPTDKLLDLFSKYLVLLQGEYIEPRFRTDYEIAEKQVEKAVLEGLAAPAALIKRKPRTA